MVTTTLWASFEHCDVDEYFCVGQLLYHDTDISTIVLTAMYLW